MRHFLGEPEFVHPSACFEPPVKLYKGVRIFGNVHVGRFSYISHYTKVGSRTRIGRFCSVGPNIEIAPPEHPIDWLSTHPFQYDSNTFKSEPGYDLWPRMKKPEHKATEIGHDVWIGAKCIVKAGVTIGSGAVIGGGSTVVHDVAPYSVVAGIPAKPLRSRFDPEVVELLLELEWWTLQPDQLQTVKFDDIRAAIDQVQAIKKRRSEHAEEVECRELR